MEHVRETKMSAEERQQRILIALDRLGFVTVPNMAKDFGVSEMTMRRDLDKLADAGKLERTHGGAMALHSADKLRLDLVEPTFESRAAVSASEKQAIARCAAGIVTAGQTVALDIGSTCFALAQQLAHEQINVFTSSLKIAAFLAEQKANAYVPPGQVHGSEPSIIGPQAVDHLEKFRFDIAFIGISGVAETGFYDYSLEDANVKRTLVKNSQRAVVLADSTKFDRMSVALISDFGPVESIITDTEPPEWLAEACKAADTKITAVYPE